MEGWERSEQGWDEEERNEVLIDISREYMEQELDRNVAQDLVACTSTCQNLSP